MAPTGKTTVAALQGRQYTYTSEEAWAQGWAQALSEAASLGVRLAVLSGSPGWDEVWEGPLAKAGELAARFGIWLVADLGPQRDDDGRVFPALHVITDDGSLAGVQRQIHLTRQDEALLYSPGEDLRIFETPVGALGLLVGADVLVPEVSRALTLLGAEVLAHVGALRDASEGAWLARLWREVQANQTFGLEAYAVGTGLAGRSAVLGPAEMTPERNGILAQSVDMDGECVVVADLDWDARAAVIEKFNILAEMNLGMYRSQLLSLDRKAAQT